MPLHNPVRPMHLSRLLALALAAAACLAPATGLDRPFPPVRGEAPTPERVELGRLLFFDPVLSGDRSLSCAHCHRPELAFSDGRKTALGAGGAQLARNAPTLYNAAFKESLFWDRRAGSLEEQALGPLLASDEMAADPAVVVARLAAIPEYARRFEAAFASEAEPLSFGNVVRAIASFERTLVSQDSRYDRFARGDRSALDASERRGLTLFRSLNTRCFECHQLPTFEAPLAMGVGVPSSDRGIGGAHGRPGQDGLFAIPTLRNVAVTAPYMHDGSLATLDEVVAFYRKGGGRPLGVEPGRIHEHVRPFDIRDDEARDLIAFLHALTDESARPETPAAVPSGLPVLRERRFASSEETRP
ncbi:MAG: cytochrome-c peroxidase [Deltaproteobacteria bacterium]|nr:cytochrome-c peroxidase [Deltaproteobacteria bacterium]MBW2447256.1 cytochrome-c peroxidase [Deltaproteobacteria bacterium]